MPPMPALWAAQNFSYILVPHSRLPRKASPCHHFLASESDSRFPRRRALPAGDTFYPVCHGRLPASGWPGMRGLCPGGWPSPRGRESSAYGGDWTTAQRGAGSKEQDRLRPGSLGELTSPQLGLHCRKRKKRTLRPRGQRGQWQRGVETRGVGSTWAVRPPRGRERRQGQGDDRRQCRRPGATGASECRAQLGVGEGPPGGGAASLPVRQTL